MNTTTNYNLPQWEDSDRVTRESVNGAMSSIDAALAAAGGGNCKIVYGTYTGTGEYGTNHEIRLTFDAKPVFIAVRQYCDNTASDPILLGVRGSPRAIPFKTSNDLVWLGWFDRAVRWYHDTNAEYMLNKGGETYAYVVLLAADE